MLVRFLILIGLLASPALAQQVTPSLSLDSTGVFRGLSVADPTMSGSGTAKQTPLGTLDAAHSFTSTGTLQTLTSRTNYHPNVAPAYIRTLGYSQVGTGGALYAKVVSQPTHLLKFSITDAAGATVWYGIADSERPINPEMLGAIGNDALDDTAAVAGVTSSFINPVSGLGKSYRVNGSIWLRGNLVLQDITLVQTGTVATLSNVGDGGIGPFTFRNVKIDYTAVAKNNGSGNLPMGLRIQNSHDIDIDGLEVTGNGMGTAVNIYNSNKIRVTRLYVHDIEWTAAVDPAGEQVVGFYCHTCTDMQLDDFRIDNLWGAFPWKASENIVGQGLSWRQNAGNSYRAMTLTGTTGATPPTCTSGTCSDGAVTWQYMGAYPAVHRSYEADGIDISEIVRGTISNGHISRVWEGFDAVGGTNSNLYLSNILYSDIEGAGEKWGHCVFNGGSIGSRVVRAGGYGFVVGVGSSTDSCGPTHLRIVDSVAMDVGYNGNFAGAVAITAYKIIQPSSGVFKPISDLRIINALAVDDQAVHTMPWGFASEVDDPNVVLLINPRSQGHTIAAYTGLTKCVTEIVSSDASTKLPGSLTLNGAETINWTAAGTTGLLTLNGTQDTTAGTNLFIKHTRPAAANGDNIGNVFFQGSDSAGNPVNYGAIVSDAQVATDTLEQGLLLLKTNIPGSNLSERLRIANGVMVTGTATPTDPGSGNLRVQFGVQLGVTAVASLPTCNAGLEGMLRSVTDANSAVFNAAAVGGGTNHMSVRCNGTAWVVH